ncbi:Flagellar hook-associated protein FlgL [gamma proteobacterium IMCC2047]|nr:Flagellar hook-associated protein FlgL [gamma proteobacterium IMCC2047]
MVTNQAAYDAFYPDDAVITFTVAGPNTTYSVTRVSDGTAVSGGVPAQPLTNIPYVPGEAIAFEGIQLQVSGAPANGDVFTAVHSNPQKLDILSIVENLAIGLDTLGEGDAANLQRGELISDALISLDNAMTAINQTTSKIGARLNTIDSVESANEEIKLFHRNTLSDIEDLDYTEAISLLTQSTFVLQAAQQSYLKVNNLSLFNFIRG